MFKDWGALSHTDATVHEKSTPTSGFLAIAKAAE